MYGVVSKAKTEGIHSFGDKSKYNEWFFIYDPTQDTGKGLLSGPYNPNRFMGSLGKSNTGSSNTGYGLIQHRFAQQWRTRHHAYRFHPGAVHACPAFHYPIAQACAEAKTNPASEDGVSNSWRRSAYTLNEEPQPQVLLTFGFSNLKPAPSSVSK